ncbi:VapC toxin family PIN domain ribonuclease, partial [Thermus scotoductus]
MVLDTSAVLAILLREPGYETLLQRIVRGEPPKIGAPT